MGPSFICKLRLKSNVFIDWSATEHLGKKKKQSTAAGNWTKTNENNQFPSLTGLFSLTFPEIDSIIFSEIAQKASQGTQKQHLTMKYIATRTKAACFISNFLSGSQVYRKKVQFRSFLGNRLERLPRKLAGNLPQTLAIITPESVTQLSEAKRGVLTQIFYRGRNFIGKKYNFGHFWLIYSNWVADPVFRRKTWCIISLYYPNKQRNAVHKAAQLEIEQNQRKQSEGPVPRRAFDWGAHYWPFDPMDFCQNLRARRARAQLALAWKLANSTD